MSRKPMEICDDDKNAVTMQRLIFNSTLDPANNNTGNSNQRIFGIEELNNCKQGEAGGHRKQPASQIVRRNPRSLSEQKGQNTQKAQKAQKGCLMKLPFFDCERFCFIYKVHRR